MRTPLARPLLLAVMLGVVPMLAHPVTRAEQAIARSDRTAAPAFGAAARRLDAFVEAARLRKNYLPGQVLVKFRPGAAVPRRNRALSVLRSRPTVGDLRWIGETALLDDATEPDAERLAVQLRRQPEVEFAQPNYIRKLPYTSSALSLPLVTGPLDPARQPNDPDYPVLQWNFGLINMPGAWTINPGAAPSLTIAVIDTGLTASSGTLTAALWTGQGFETKALPFARSPDFSASRIAAGRDFIFLEAGSPVLDFVGHGTHVASTIAEDANTLSLLGIAYNAQVMPLKVCVGYWEIMLARAERGLGGFIPPDSGGCADDAIAEAVRYAADNGARIINISIGGPEPAPAQRDALVYAVGRGAFVSLASGNEFEIGNPVEYPAAYGLELDGVLSVGAVGKSRARAFYSSTRNTEIVAPGGNDREGGGADAGFVWQVTLSPRDQDPGRVTVPRFDRYEAVGYEGTSMAAPHVAGVAALLMTQGDLRSPRAIEAFLKSTAQDLGAPGRDDDFGHGLIQARTALRGLGIRR